MSVVRRRLAESVTPATGSTPKTIHTEHGSVRIEQPRDRAGSFEPQIVPKHQRRFDGFDEKIVAMYARGMSVRDIQAHLAELYGVEVGHDLISRVTDAVLDDVREWQARPLEDVYPILFLDALIVKVRDGGAVRNKACYVAVGVNLDGERDVLGLWFQASEGAKFWLAVLSRAQAARRPGRPRSAASTGSKGSPKRSRPSSRRPGCRPASST